ncbi:hypothetical protein B0J13DRAFT_546748 [Dactylonectria estremocensis]|uniref:Uncharacterized protein n=1 Tax=Dactylonectria estremocensis TaxID=1079267 RepID=A0A9P9F314_9HYPO|nr:hypothetical protein B0J13DRAFT_546748 [Dactylonectria estremocensis]
MPLFSSVVMPLSVTNSLAGYAMAMSISHMPHTTCHTATALHRPAQPSPARPGPKQGASNGSIAWASQWSMVAWPCQWQVACASLQKGGELTLTKFSAPGP